jgi:hypothetical protein
MAASEDAVSVRHGNSARFGRLVVEPEILHFKDAVLGQVYVQPVTLTNRGRSAVVIWDVDRSNANFRLRAMKLPLRLAPGESVSLEIGYVPNRRGRVDTDFIFRSSRSTHLVLHADGNGATEGLISNPRKVDFGNVPMGRREHLPVTLTNSNSESLTLTRASASGGEFGFWGLDLPVTLAPGESITFNATFAPRRTGGSAGRIILDTPGVNLAIRLDGEGSPVGQLSTAPIQLSFGNVTVGACATLTGRLVAGAADVTIYSAGITSSEFALSGISFPLTIPAGQSKFYKMTFSPSSSGEASAIISFQSSSADSRIEQALVGIGTRGQSHSVNLSWNPGSSGVVGYNVYRANSSGGPYSRINSAPDPSTSYLDTTVFGGQTYFYVTTAIASNGKQSAFSNWVEVAIP